MKVFLYLVISLGIVFVAGLNFLCLSSDYDVAVIKGRSMSPVINHGDLVITAKPQREIEPGMIIIYNQSNRTVIHRVISIENGQLKTKGDAGKYLDPWFVQTSEIKGIYLLKIPYLGYIASFTRTFFYWILVIILLAIFVLYIKEKKERLIQIKSSKEGGERMKGITLMEGLIIIAILGVLAAVVVPPLNRLLGG